MKKKLAAFAGLAALAGALCSSAAMAQEEIKVGLLLPYKGVFAQLGEDIDRAWELALEQRGGMAAGRKIVLVKADTEADPTVGVRVANRLIRSDGVDVLAGTVSSAVALAVSDLSKRTKTPLVLALAVADELNAENCHPYAIRSGFSAHALQEGSGAYWANELQDKTAVTLGPDYAAGRAMIRGFVDGFTANGGTVKDQYWTVFRQTKDWGPVYAKAKDSGAAMVYAWYAGAESIQAVKQHAEFGLQDTMPLRGDQWLYDSALWSAMGKDTVLGARYATVYTSAAGTPASDAFVKAYSEKYGMVPNVTAGLGYDNALAVLDGIEAVKGDVSDGKAYVDAIRGLTIDAPRGRITFSDANSAQLEKLYLVEVAEEGGKLVEKLVKTIEPGKDLPGCKMDG
ncbi:ABC transporter substrate-binding protein [Propylenella binzhouense]|nr:ABC transporter substrate-binding protein [Propylenella binzhouense]